MHSRDDNNKAAVTTAAVARSDINEPPKAPKAVDPHVAAIAELAALVDALAGQTPNAHQIQARVAALRARIDAL